MATLLSGIQFTGSVGELSAYKMRGSDKIILRKKGGPSRKQIKTAPAFANVRRANAEFGGRATASGWIIRLLGPQKILANASLAGRINGLLKPIQELDTTSAWGQRHIQLSKNPHLLAGFALNDVVSLDAVIRTPFSFLLSRENRTAQVTIPALWPRLNFFPTNQSFYRLQVVLGMVPDIFFNDGTYQPSSIHYSKAQFAMVATPWLPVMSRANLTTLEVTLLNPPPDDYFSLMLSVGLCYGTIKNQGVIEPVKYTGCGKVLGVV